MVFGKGKQTNPSELGRKGGIAVHEKHSHNGEENPNWKGGISKNNYHYKKIQMMRYPERIKAREVVRSAIKSEKLKRPNYCIQCGEWVEREKIQAHHEDYNQPLKVVWLCKDCHCMRHG